MPVPAPNTYPFDSTGSLPSNLITDELQTLSAINFRDYYCIVPDFAPFYSASLSIQYRVDSSSPWLTMNEGVDYYCGFQFIGATRQTALPVYGSIVFNNIALTGEVKLLYQTVGGEWTLDQDTLTEMLVNLIYNPRTTSWEQVSGAPAHFPPSTHAWQLDDLVGMSEVVNELEAIEDAILNRDTNSDFNAHIANFNNPHKTNKSHVGLGQVMNYPPATVAEVIDGTNPELYVTPTGLHAYIDSLGLNDALNFVSLEEVVNKISVNKILTFDLFLLFMKIYYGLDTEPVNNNTEIPTIIVPAEGGDYTPTQMFTCNTFANDSPGTITRTISLSSAGTHVIPQGANTVRITGRGGIGGSTIAPYTTITEPVSGLGQGTIVIPAGGSIMSVRCRGAAGTQSNSAGIYTPNGLGQLNNVPPANPAPGNPSWSYSIVTAFPTNFQINSQLQTITTQIVIRKNFSNGVSFTADPIPITLTLGGSNFSGSLLSYAGSFTVIFGDATSLTAVYEAELSRLPGTDVTVGATATVTINGGIRTYVGSNTQSPPDTQSNDIAIIATEITTVNYNSPPGTFLEIIYQDYTTNGTWAIKRYYSSKITNPSTGGSGLVEDTNGSVVAITPGVTGQSLSISNLINTVATAGIPGTYELQVVAGSSNASFRLFEFNYNISGTPVTIRVVAEFTSNSGQTTAGSNATVTVLGNTITYTGSANNNVSPEVRTDTMSLNASFSTTVLYDCPAGTSVVLVYTEPDNVAAVVHSDTVWEISTDELFSANDVVDSTELGKGSGFTLTQWRPTQLTELINNTFYFVRCRWVRTDASLSDWSEVREFKYIAPIVYPPRDSEHSRYCKGFDLYGIYNDGQGGTYEKPITVNSTTCGYVAPIPDRRISATGGVVYDRGCWRIHEFREVGNSSFVVQDLGTFGGVVEYLVVGSGGPGGTAPGNQANGTGAGACGGGGGGDVIVGSRTVNLGANNVTVGAAGTGATNGGNSIFLNLIALGGGRGGAYNGDNVPALPGGSGGGAGQAFIGQTKNGAPSSSGLGNAGGDCFVPAPQATGGGGGGGGAGGRGEDAQRRGQPSPIHGGNGGAGVLSSITTENKYYGAGGGGGGCNASGGNGIPTPSGDPGAGGSGVGGNGGTYQGVYSTAGFTNSGSGGGGGTGPQRPGSAGAVGVVIIRYRIC